jgi:flagellar hook-length control protein FliK
MTFDQNFVDLAKYLKYIQLTSQDDHLNINKDSLDGFLQKTLDKLEKNLKENTSSSRNDIIHKVFTPLVRSVKEETLTIRQSQMDLTANQLDTRSTKEAITNQQLKSTDETSKSFYMNKDELKPKDSTSNSLNKNKEEIKLVSNSDSKFISMNGDVFLSQGISKPEQIVLLHTHSARLVSSEELIQQFESILAKNVTFRSGLNERLLIKFNPEHLGEMRVEIIKEGSVMMAKIMTSTESAKELLESQINSLKSAFLSQNLQIERIEISQQLNQQERSFNKDSDHQREQQQQQEQDEQKQQEHPFKVSFEETLLNLEV